MQILDIYVSMYTSYELSTMNNVTSSTDRHTFHIIGTYPCTNIPASLYTCPTALLLSSTHTLHITAKFNMEVESYI